MHRVLLASALVATLLVPAAAGADPVREAGSRTAQKGAEQAAATCRRDPVRREDCARLLGTRDASEAAIAAYEPSEVSRALDLQRTLGDALPLRAGLWVGTHNSANSTSEKPTLSQNDSNQQLSLTDQLRLDVRSLELDAHWFPSLRSAGRAPVLCHAQGAPAHVGCSTERLLEDGLAEIAAWLRGNPGEIVLLYLEDHLEGREGHDKAARDLDKAFGTLLYAPPAGGTCRDLPLDLTRDQVRDAGKQVVVMTRGCKDGSSAAWHAAVFNDKAWLENRPVRYVQSGCGGFSKPGDDARLVRYFEDTTVVNALATPTGATSLDDGLTPPTLGAMMRCGVDLLGLDQLVPGDGRLEALVWSFAPGELDGAAGEVAVQRSQDGRWESTAADGRRPAACRAPDGSWLVTGAGPRVSAKGRCEELGAVFAVPSRGRDAQLLLEVQRAARADRVWLALDSAGGGRWA